MASRPAVTSARVSGTGTTASDPACPRRTTTRSQIARTPATAAAASGATTTATVSPLRPLRPRRRPPPPPLPRRVDSTTATATVTTVAGAPSPTVTSPAAPRVSLRAASLALPATTSTARTSRRTSPLAVVARLRERVRTARLSRVPGTFNALPARAKSSLARLATPVRWTARAVLPFKRDDTQSPWTIYEGQLLSFRLSFSPDNYQLGWLDWTSDACTYVRLVYWYLLCRGLYVYSHRRALRCIPCL